MEKLRLQHLSSPRGSSSSFIPALSSLLFRIRHAFRFRIALDDIHSTTLQGSSDYQLFDSVDTDFVAKDFGDTIRIGIGENYAASNACNRGLTDVFVENSLYETFER